MWVPEVCAKHAGSSSSVQQPCDILCQMPPGRTTAYMVKCTMSQISGVGWTGHDVYSYWWQDKFCNHVSLWLLVCAVVHLMLSMTC